MQDEIDTIIKKAGELSAIISEHGITRRYTESLELLKHDRRSMELLDTLISLGRDLSEKISRNEPASAGNTAENDLLKRELDSNILIKNYLLAQKEYLNLLGQVIEKIKNPPQSS